MVEREHFFFQASRIKITYVRFKGPEEHVPGKQAVEDIIRKYNATAKSFSHSSVSSIETQGGRKRGQPGVASRDSVVETT